MVFNQLRLCLGSKSNFRWHVRPLEEAPEKMRMSWILFGESATLGVGWKIYSGWTEIKRKLQHVMDTAYMRVQTECGTDDRRRRSEAICS